jgi:hypothetical protein
MEMGFLPRLLLASPPHRGMPENPTSTASPHFGVHCLAVLQSTLDMLIEGRPHPFLGAPCQLSEFCLDCAYVVITGFFPPDHFIVMLDLCLKL